MKILPLKNDDFGATRSTSSKHGPSEEETRRIDASFPAHLRPGYVPPHTHSFNRGVKGDKAGAEDTTRWVDLLQTMQLNFQGPVDL